MKNGTFKKIFVILGIIASVIVIGGAVKSGIDTYKNNKDTTTDTTSQSACVRVVDMDLAA